MNDNTVLEKQKLENRKLEDLTPKDIAIIQSEWELMDAIANDTFKGYWLPYSRKSTASIMSTAEFAAEPELTDEEKEEFDRQAAQRRVKMTALKQWLAERDNGSHPVK